MDKQNGKLKYIMELLNISGQFLADQLLVSRSLVSKWKNNKLPFNPSSYHFNSVINALVKINNQQNVKTLERFFENIIPDLDKSNHHWVKDSLQLWLAGNIDYNIEKKSKTHNTELYTAKIRVFDGNEGKRQAFREFFECACKLPEGQEIYYSDMEEISWLTENHTFYKYWNEMMIKMFEKGHTMNIIHNIGREFLSILTIISNWLPLYFTGNLHSHYLQNIDYNVSAPSVYVIKGQMAVISFDSMNKPKDRYTAVYTDPLSIAQMIKIYEARYEASEKLVSIYRVKYKEIDKLTNNIIQLGQKTNEVYFTTKIPTFSTMDRETLLEVLKENNLNSELINKIMKVHEEIQTFFLKDIKHNFCRQIYDIEAIKNNLESENIIYAELSTLALQPIVVSKEHYKAHLRTIIEFIDLSENFQVALEAFDSINMPFNSSVWAKQNCFIYAYPLYEAAAVALCDEPTIIYSFFLQLEKLWNHIPMINKQQAHIKELLLKIINM